MKKNMGNLDRGLRIGVAVVIGALIFFGTIDGITAIILGIVGVIFLLTSVVSFCPLYTVLKISTNKQSP